MKIKEKERALAHIEKIEWIKPIEGADNIELIGLLGWCCISKKNEFKVGDLAVYIEIDSKCNESDERFEFLASKHYKIKTMRLGKFNCFSQGLALPLSLFPELSDKKIGDDVTKELKITYSSLDDIQRKSNGANKEDKYKAMANRKPQLFKKQIVRKIMKYKLGRAIMFMLFGKKKDSPKEFPKWIARTDEQRIENCPFHLQSEDKWIKTEKLDGCFSYRMVVKTNKGDLPIGKIVRDKMDVMVATYNEENDIIEYKKIIDYHKINSDKNTMKIGVGFRGKGNRNKFIECTENHEFFTKDGWKEARFLKDGDCIYHFSKSFPYEIKQLILGSLLGDACINSNSKNGNYRSIHFSHSEKQLDYFNYKKRVLGKYCLGEKNRTSGYGSKMYDMHTTTNLDLNNFINTNCMVNNKKTVTKDWICEVDPLGLAFWYMDDGSIQNRDSDNLSCRITLNTQGFSFDEHLIIVDFFKTRYNIDVTIGDKEVYKGHVIIFDVKNTEKFCAIVAPYICDSMKYKLPKKYESIPCVYQNINVLEEDSISETIVKSIETFKPHKFGEYMYDLTIEDNHNYFVQSILVHNCSCTFAVDKNKKGYEFIVCSRNVRQKDRDQSCYHESNIYWELADKYNVKDILTKFAKENGYNRVVLQGEGVGNVQSNPYKLDDNRLYVFNLIVDGIRLGTLEMVDFCDNNDLIHVPIIDESYMLPKTMEEMKLEADGYSEINPKVKREGFVYRSLDGQKSFKNVSREYLLKHS